MSGPTPPRARRDVSEVSTPPPGRIRAPGLASIVVSTPPPGRIPAAEDDRLNAKKDLRKRKSTAYKKGYRDHFAVHGDHDDAKAAARKAHGLVK